MTNVKLRSSQLPYKFILEGLVWMILISVAWWGTLAAVKQESRLVIIYTCSLSILVGLRIFLGHGAGTVTATGLFGLSTAMFIGYSGLILVEEPHSQAGWSNLALACVMGLTMQVATAACSWGKSGRFKREPRWADNLTANWLVRVGIFFLALSAITHFLFPGIRGWAEAAAFSAICVLTSGLILRKNVKIISWNTIIIGNSLFLYAEFFHSGGGRLRFVALACAVAILVSIRFPQPGFKIAIVIAMPVVIAWLALNRLAFQESLSAGASQGRTGLESMTAPLNVLSLLLTALQEDRFSPARGYNLLSVFAPLFPESVWTDRPLALGYELVQFVAPERYADGIYSTVATSLGEGIFNFGWMGLPIVIAFSALALRFLDSRLLSQLNKVNISILGVLSIILISMLSGAVADYTWSGVHTYLSRIITRLPVFLVIVILALLKEKTKKTNALLRVKS